MSSLSDAVPSPLREMREWSLATSRPYARPFVDVRVTATFTSPSGAVLAIEAFHDGDGVWKVRFNPGKAGMWTYAVASTPANPDFAREGSFEVTPRDTRGFLRSTPGTGWGFTFESGDPVFILGDTVYHLFGMAHNSSEGPAEVRAFMERRAAQGFNLLRIRLPVSYFHPVDGYNVWQTTRLWPWGGSEQSPRFDQFDLPYFRTVDRVVAWAEELGIGIEMIMEGWGNEFPFNRRDVFVAEWEELWLRYLVARYDAFAAVWFWTLHNEYEYYPNGNWNYDAINTSCDLWAIRTGRLVREVASHGHAIAIHNGPVTPSFGKRFAADPMAIDTVMFQTWGTTGEHDAWLAAGIEETIERSLGDWPGTAVFSEYGYEFNPDLPPLMLGHQYCGPDHTRRGAWRGAFRSLGVVHGFENSWGPFQILDEDQPGLPSLLHLNAFFTEVVDFAALRPADDLLEDGEDRPGYAPLALATADRSTIAVYFPAGGDAGLTIDLARHTGRWFDPRTGVIHEANPGPTGRFLAPADVTAEHPDDWVLLLRR
ncbi:MAG TPA: DUF4038 domain-containing protein [Thermomicrobiales bacterium]|nr:DUF4038 domain-containing protein [Thermomicrobiales bacterium]